MIYGLGYADRKDETVIILPNFFNCLVAILVGLHMHSGGTRPFDQLPKG